MWRFDLFIEITQIIKNSIMKKALNVILFVLLFNTIYAQTTLSGEVIVTNPKRASIALNYEYDAGTIGSFSYDGKALFLSIGKHVYNNVTTSIGLGFKPTGETCFYVSLEDGIDLDVINVEGTGKFYGNSLKLSFNPSIKYEYCVNWISNTSFSVHPRIASYQNMVIKPKVSVSYIPQLLLKSKAEIESGLVLQNKNEETIEAYCLDQDKKVPQQGVRFTYSNDSIVNKVMFDDDRFDNPFIIQSLLYGYMDGYSISEDDIIYILKCENSSLFFFRQCFIIKYSNGYLESSVPLPLDHINASMNIEKLLQGKIDNRVYFNEDVDSEVVQYLKQVLLMYGAKEDKDGSFICPECNAEQSFEVYSQFVTPLYLNYYAAIIELLEGAIDN